MVKTYKIKFDQYCIVGFDTYKPGDFLKTARGNVRKFKSFDKALKEKVTMELPKGIAFIES